MHSGETLLLAVSVNTFRVYLHNWAALNMGVNPWKLPAFVCIKTTHKRISKQIASARGCLSGIDFVPTTLWMYVVLKYKVAWHFKHIHKYENESMEMNATTKVRNCNPPHTFRTNIRLTCGFLKSAYFSIRSTNISLFWLSLVQFRRFSTKFSWSSKILSAAITREQIHWNLSHFGTETNLSHV